MSPHGDIIKVARHEFLAFSKCKILILDSIGETTMAMTVDWKKRSPFQFQNPI
jgi:hypothetical protein